ncbi:Hydroxypyruvate isomerase [Mycobacterium basiliense]|uniref:Hydroxypyruvate isomerase n=1 Tax=Mycobacterium basiliense TaxID=2094119 RepID=A0A3S4BVW1_9MYCO|nr:metabolite traffic protein EboE [Mycobacterium basiliense]VDM88774.1 Hydroxypyruvate isomerase [Mycobacterium basiliense]
MLSYCSNVVAADSLSALEHRLVSLFSAARELAHVEQLGVGLWLPARTMAQLAEDRPGRRRLAQVLADNGLAVVTMNAFPYGDFHGDTIKHAVYQPNWAESTRLAYTRNCAEVLSDLLPEGECGSISTLPLGWSAPWDDESDASSRQHLRTLSDELQRIEAESGHRIRLAIEPEPGCVIGSCRDAIDWFGGAGVDPQHVGLCLDICHLAVMHENTAEVLAGLSSIGFDVVKIQASNAIQIDDLADGKIADAFAEFANSPYLHQVFGVDGDGRQWFRDDLSLGDRSTPKTGSARVHYHVPLHISPPAPLRNTAHILTETMAMLREGVLSEPVHIEIETYTWEVLPSSLRMGSLAEDLAAEISWLDELMCVRDPA